MASSTTSDLDVALKDYLSETRGVVSILKNVLIRTVQVVPMVSTVYNFAYIARVPSQIVG